VRDGLLNDVEPHRSGGDRLTTGAIIGSATQLHRPDSVPLVRRRVVTDFRNGPQCQRNRLPFRKGWGRVFSPTLALLMDKTKTCTRCEVTKDLSAFSPAKANKKDGRSSWCRECHATYVRERRLTNPEKARANTAQWKRDNPEKARASELRQNERVKALRAADPEPFRKRARAKYARNPEPVKRAQRKWRESKTNRAKNAAGLAAWAEANPEKDRDSRARTTARRRARKASVESQPYTRREIYDRDGGTCRSCGALLALNAPGAFHVDHIVPYALGGPDIPANVQALCPACNMSKQARLEGQIHLPV
jgi:5-methylcytosine-specific restriction endonuclease McrA